MKALAFVPRLFTINAGAHYLGISERLLEQYIEQGVVKTKRLRRPEDPKEFIRRTLIEREELDRLADSGIAL